MAPSLGSNNGHALTNLTHQSLYNFRPANINPNLLRNFRLTSGAEGHNITQHFRNRGSHSNVKTISTNVCALLRLTQTLHLRRLTYFA
ncbi:MAG: hypothetical protein ACTS44_00445 [Candidatus Hodgkinia cicadicola]